MKRSHLMLLLALTLTARSSVKAQSVGQGKIESNGPAAGKETSKVNKLIGTWRLIEATDLDPLTSSWTYPFGKNPKGYFTYTRSGIVNLNISTEAPIRISEDSAKNYNINLLDWLDHHSVGYFGTYTIDFDQSVVTHHVQGGALPWYNNTDQPRPFVLKGDTLVLTDGKTWKRVLVRVD